ncbi:MAG: hypothetical protein E7182_03495 [Erysipelotrichaceae bacterium]|nr:hypothetical protein [Erysipelotrichaceae bacterium]
MSVRDKWKAFGVNTGKAFASFGKSMATTAKVVVGKQERVDEEGHSTLKRSWTATGKGFGQAGASLGKAASATAKKVVGKDEPNIIDAEVVSETDAEEGPTPTEEAK